MSILRKGNVACFWTLKPIFHVHAQRKDPTPGTQCNLYSTGWRWGFASGETQILAFSDTNMLVSPTQNSGVGGLSQRQGPTQLFCVAVEYRLKTPHVPCRIQEMAMSHVTIFFRPNVAAANVHVALSNLRNSHVALSNSGVEGHGIGRPAARC